MGCIIRSVVTKEEKKMIANSNLEQGGMFTSFLRCEITQLREKQITQTKTSFILIYLWKKSCWKDSQISVEVRVEG